jgi:DNA-binding NtrC family response regulator
MILIIDDEIALREVMTEILELYEINTLTVGSGEEGAELFKQHADQLRMVFLDLHLPGMGGYATLQAIRAVSPTVHVVIMSGQPEYMIMAEFEGQEHLSYLEKPFTLDTIVTIVDQFLDPDHPE